LVRRPRLVLGFDRFAPTSARASRSSLCVPRPIVRPIGDPLLRFGLLQGSVRVALPASTGASPGVPGPRASAHFQRSARDPSPTDHVLREELARALMACRRLLPRGLPAVGDGRLRATSRVLSCARPRSRARGAPESASPSEVTSSFEAAIPFRGPWFVVVPPDKIHPKRAARTRQAPHILSTVSGAADCGSVSTACLAIARCSGFFPRPSTACEYRRAASRDGRDPDAPVPVPRG
jgi:hypothetical protein